jgi:uncharacterized membrane protein
MKWLVLMLSLLCIACVSAQDIGVRSIRYDEAVRPGDDVFFYVSVVDQGAKDLHDVRLDITSPDGIDLFGTAGEFDVDRNDAESFIAPVYVPYDTPQGDYYVRFTIRDDKDNVRRVYRVLSVQ